MKKYIYFLLLLIVGCNSTPRETYSENGCTIQILDSQGNLKETIQATECVTFDSGNLGYKLVGDSTWTVYKGPYKVK